MKSPCMTCENRKLGCHSKCKEYAAWSEERQAAIKELTDHALSLASMFDYGGRWKKGHFNKK